MPSARRSGPAGPSPPRPGAITPLEGVSVADFSQNIAGPYATQILADMGADVVKVEPPGGDPARRWGPPFVWGQSTLFQAVNRNKRGVVLDLKSSEGQARARELAARSDVVFQALRPGAAERFGIGCDQVRAENPGVIYVSILAYGESGPLRSEPGYDPLMQARSGLMSVNGHETTGPARVGTSIVDLGTGMWAATAVMGALRERDRTGAGCHVTVSLLDTALAWMSYHLTGYLAGGPLPGPMGTSIAMIAPYQAFPASDGAVMIAAGNDDIFARLCRALDLEDLPRRAEFADNAGRVARSRELAELVAERTRAHSSAGLLDLMSRHRVPAAPIHTVESALQDPQTAASGMIQEHRDPRRGAYVDIPMPIRWDGLRAALRSFPPTAGEHQESAFRDEAGAGDAAAGERASARNE